ncbi:MAG TPA: hypothetical protein VEX88_03010 [Glaciibacter sp.]|nr:hypothetical protein [Glaciibacter sp.]
MPTLKLRAPNGVTSILLATVIAGGCGYLVTAIVAASRPAADYVDFGVFWSALYLVIAALSGLQQEVTRGTRRRLTSRHASSPAFVFGAVSSLVTAVLIVGTAPLWKDAVFAESGWTFVVPLAVGAASYVVVAVLCGTMYGLELWRSISLMISIDGILRLIGVLVLLGLAPDNRMLAWAVVLPFPLTPLLLWFFVRRGITGRSELDVGYRQLVRNALGTVAAAAALGVLVSGFPLVLSALSPEASRAELGASLAAINLIRAPLVIVVLSLQSYFIVRFRNSPTRAYALFVRLTVVIGAVTLVAAALAWIIGPSLLALLGRDYSLSGAVLAGLVATSGVLAVLCVSGPLTLARSQHGVFTAGWIVAATATVLALLIPGDLAPRMLLSLAVGPILGILVHLGGIHARERRSRLRV